MQVKERVFVLRTTKYGDNDLILNCLTASGSRLSLIARGAIKSKKRFGGGILEPMNYLQINFEDKTSKRNENPLHTLKEATLLQGFDALRTDYTRIETGLYFVRLISECVREGDLESSELFNLLGNTLKAAETSKNLDRLRTHFEVKLLSNQGVLAIDESEQAFLALPISEHERLEISEPELAGVRARVRRVLSEYLEHV
jgi:DNA repair protein RecO (recombination protein O)